MTEVILLQELKKFVEKSTKDIVLLVRPVKNKGIDGTKEETPPPRAAEVHLMRLPDKEAYTQRIPYILLQVLTGADNHVPGEYPETECTVRIVFAVYSEDGSEGAADLLNLMTSLRIALLKSGEIGKQFLLKKPLEYFIYPDDTDPYHMGEMMTIWEMPVIKREAEIR